MSQKNKKLIYGAVRKILRPLIKLMMRHEISHSELTELTKQIFVEVAYKDFAIPGRKTTYSRIAVLTGLSRKEVVRLTKLCEPNELVEKVRPNRAMRVVNGWLNDPEFLDKDNTPLTLPISGDSSSFRILAERYSGDITIGALLDELGRLGVITQPNESFVKMEVRDNMPAKGEVEKLDVLAMCVSDLMDTGVHNLFNVDDSSRFQQQVTCHNLSVDVSKDFKSYGEEKSKDLLQDFKRYLDKKKNVSPGVHAEIKRIGVGIYFFEDNNNDAEG